MLLKKECGRQLSALSLCLAVMFAPLLTAQADEPEIVPTDSSAATGAQPTSLSQPLEQSPATAVMAGMDQGLQSVVTAEASVGSRQLEAQNAGNLGEDLSLVYAKTRSNLEDLDVPKAASDLAMAQMALQASQLSFSKVQGMSLFNYI